MAINVATNDDDAGADNAKDISNVTIDIITRE